MTATDETRDEWTGRRFGGRYRHVPWEAVARLAMAGGGHRGRGRGRDRGGPFGFGGARGGFPFGPFGGGSFFRHGPRVGRGDVRAAALLLLAEEPRNGYQIIQELAERSGGVWRPSSGAVYPALQQLEDEGLIAADERDGRRVLELTDAGRAYLAAKGEELVAPWEAMNDRLDDEVRELRSLVGQVVAAFMQVAQAGNDAQIAAARQVMTDSRRALYRILADDEPAPAGRDASEGS